MAATPGEAVRMTLDGVEKDPPNRSTALGPAHGRSTAPTSGANGDLTREQHLEVLALGLVEYVGPSPAGDPMYWPTSRGAAAALGDAGVVVAVATHGEV